MHTVRVPTGGLLQRKVESLTVELLGVYEELALLYSLGTRIAHLNSEHEIGAVAVEEAIEISSAECGWIAFWNGTQFELPERSRKGISVETASTISQTVLAGLLGRGKNEFLSHSLVSDYCLCQTDAPTRFLACALLCDGKCHGYLCLGRGEKRGRFLSPDQKLVHALAHVVAVRLENGRLQRSESEKQRLLQELETARAIQQSLSSASLPQTSFLKTAGSNEPCYQIGGDFYDLIPIDDSFCVVIVADVAGKGPSAALQAALMQGAIHGIVQTRPHLPSLLQTLNDCLLRRGSGGFMTTFMATLQKNGSLQYVNAGHPVALWIRGKQPVVELSEGGPPLGIFPKAEFITPTVILEKGDFVVLYTDGITDAEGEGGEPFGIARLLQWAEKQQGSTCDDLKQSLLSTVADFCGARTQADDRSVLIVQYEG